MSAELNTPVHPTTSTSYQQIDLTLTQNLGNYLNLVSAVSTFAALVYTLALSSDARLHMRFPCGPMVDILAHAIFSAFGRCSCTYQHIGHRHRGRHVYHFPIAGHDGARTIGCGE